MLNNTDLKAILIDDLFNYTADHIIQSWVLWKFRKFILKKVIILSIWVPPGLQDKHKWNKTCYKERLGTLKSVLQFIAVRRNMIWSIISINKTTKISKGFPKDELKEKQIFTFFEEFWRR